MSFLISNWSIRSKILASSVISLVLISGFAMWYYPLQQRAQVLSAMQAKDRSKAEMIAMAIGDAIDRGYFESIDDGFSQARADTNLSFIYVVDQQGEIFARYEAEGLLFGYIDILNLAGIVNIDDHLFHIVRVPLRFEGEEAGVLVLGSSLDSMNARIRADQLTTLYITIAVLLFGIFISTIFSRMITRPLVDLRNAAERVARGDRDIRIEITGKDEVGQLGSAFVAMSRSVHSAMEALRANREESRLIIETASDAFVSIDESGRIIEWNRQAEATFGFSREEAIGALLQDTIIPAALQSRHVEAFRLYLKAGAKKILGYRIEVPALHKDGHEFPIELAVWPVTIGDKRWFNAFATDITERKEAEEELKKLSAAVDQSSGMICITDTEGNIEYVNSQFCELTGYRLVEAIGQNSRLLKSGMHEAEFYRKMWNTITKGKTWTGQIQNKRKNGEIYWERKAISPITNSEGQITNYLSVGEDITAEIQVQQKLIEADKMSAVGMLAAGVAHEFKNYLGGIMGNASLALEEIDQPDGKEMARETLQQVIELSERANEVAMSLLTYSKTKPEEVGLENLQDIISRSIALLSKEMKNRSIEMVTHFEEVPPINISAGKIQQLLMNLLINASHAIKDHGVITIGLYNADDAIKIRISDSGRGIPNRIISKIFDPFFSTKGVWGKDEVVGTGMGLSLCRNIARESGGDLTVESVVGTGTTFEIRLPLASPRTDSKEASTAFANLHNLLLFSLDKTTVEGLKSEALANNLTLLVIDDCTKMPKDIAQSADLLICDATFPGKMELLKATAACCKAAVPYVIINSGSRECPLEEVYDDSAGNFRDIPSLDELLSAAASKIAGRSAGSSSVPSQSL